MNPEHTRYAGGGADTSLADLLMGAAAGAAAVWLMDRVDWFNYRHEDPEARQRTENVRPLGLPPADVAVEKAVDAAGVELPLGKRRALGKAVHYSIGMAPGAAYGALRERHPGIATGRGAMFGLGLFLLHDEFLNSVLGLSAKPREYPWQAHARGLVAHLVYGVALDTIFSAMKHRNQARIGLSVGA